ncbi:lactococcin 972 family bacteriocin [Streptococcus sciuri]|uniref:Lactococcin 972 family bacteriocin n=1 Tax=Streptococcus sciuri TaxID=2973939 RepID=A0ABT2F8I7_9STRE|nr:lactococcin 972 family bacteriocin [Streptococcus sciuri]MCS4488705.1 lactococcin 972 family bacteriocin [Streptococcus sciuri]
MKVRKILSQAVLATVASTTLVTTVSAAVAYPSGGVWTYGSDNGGAFSNYYHGSRYHTSTVVSRRDSHSDKGEASAGKTSYARIKTSFGEQVAFYYNFR